jgi:Gpi18-like mannosyltransferase
MAVGHAFEDRASWLFTAVLLLELLIAVYALSGLVYLLTGGVDLGWARIMRGEKLVLVLLVAIPTRMALPIPWQSGPLLRPITTWFERRVRPRVRPLTVTPAVRDVAVTLVILRPAMVGVAFLVNVLVPARGYRTFSGPFEREKLFELFAAWDSGWYFDIAKHGYYYDPDAQSSIAFFPLYPLLMRAVAWPFGESDRAIWLAGIAISWVCFAVTLVVLHGFTEACFGSRESARRAVMYLAVFPFSFFFTRVYTESLFTLLALLAVVAAYRERWWHAGMWGALAALTRPNGVLIALPLAILVFRGAPRSLGEYVRRAAGVTVTLLGIAAYCLYVYRLTGHPLAWLDAQRHWQYSIGHPPWDQLLKMIHALMQHGPYQYFLMSRIASYQFMHGVIALVFLALTPSVFRYLGAPLGVYVLVSLLVPLSGSDLQGLGRYASVLFPVFMVVGHRAGALHEPILIVSSLYRALLVALWVTLHPIY